MAVRESLFLLTNIQRAWYEMVFRVAAGCSDSCKITLVPCPGMDTATLEMDDAVVQMLVGHDSGGKAFSMTLPARPRPRGPGVDEQIDEDIKDAGAKFGALYDDHTPGTFRRTPSDADTVGA